jgi:hypothetical protein
MAVVDDVTTALREIEPELLQPTNSTLDAIDLGERIRAVRKLIAEHGDRWIGVSEAKRYLAASSADYVKAWVRAGSLRSRTLPSGRIQLSLDSVLEHREDYEVMTAIDKDAPITTEEALYLLRPLKYPRPASYPPPREPADAAR